MGKNNNRKLMLVLVLIMCIQFNFLIPQQFSLRRVKLFSEFPKVEFKILHPDFISRLSPQDRELLRQILSANPEVLTRLLMFYPEKVQIKYEDVELPQEGRTVYLRLDRPFNVDGREIRFLRIKGIRPKINNGDTLSPYTGRAHDRAPLMVDSQGKIYRARESFDIWGGMVEEEAIAEFETTRYLTSLDELHFGVDYPLALGVMRNLRFVDKNGDIHHSAFIIFGMDSEDIRFGFQGSDEEPRAFLYLCCYYNQRRRSALERILEGRDAEITTAIGRALRDLHDKGVFHRYPTTTNIGIEIGPDGFKIIFRDLGDRVLKKDLTGNVTQQEISWRFIDITRVIYDLHSTLHVTVEDDGLYFEDADATRLIFPFLKGYFYDLQIDKEDIKPLLKPGFQQERDGIIELSPDCEHPVFGILFKYLSEIIPG